MIKNLLNKYVNWVDSTGWKTFFKVYGLAVLYSFVMCLYKPDEFFAFCIFFFPLNPLELFILPFLKALGLFLELNMQEQDNILFSFGLLCLFGFLINIYRINKQEGSLSKITKKISKITKLGLVSYVFIIFLFYLSVIIFRYECNAQLCGNLKGY